MRILIISNHIMGYMEVPRLELERLGHDVEVLYYGMSPLKFEYKDFSQKLISFIRKINGNSIKKNTGKIQYGNRPFQTITIKF
jgi:hypothetical protein